MGLNCGCPVGAALSDVATSACPSEMGQIQKVVFQRIYSASGTKNKFVKASADPKVKASWTPKIAASDGTKVVTSPYLNAPTSEAGAIKTYGSGNAVLGGMPIVVGREPSTFNATILQQPQTVIAALKTFMCEEVGIFLIDENGRIGLIADNATTPANYFPIPIKTLFVGDKKLGGFDEPDMNTISWNFEPNWSDNLVFVDPTDFNALTDLDKAIVES